MTQEEIKEIVKNRSQTNSNKIDELEKYYDIRITDELLVDFVNNCFDSIKYYNKKYNIFNQNDINNLYMFCETQIMSGGETNGGYKCNLLRFAGCDIKTKLNYNKHIEFITGLSIIVCNQIRSKLLNYDEDDFNDFCYENNDKNLDEIVEVNLEGISYYLFFAYFNYYYEKNIEKTFIKLQNIINDEIINIKLGKCELLEKICLFPSIMYTKTNGYSNRIKNSLFILEDQELSDYLLYHFDLISEEINGKISTL